jgi:hypothetical protein
MGKLERAINLMAGVVMIAFDEFSRSLDEAVRIVDQGQANLTGKVGQHFGKSKQATKEDTSSEPK